MTPSHHGSAARIPDAELEAMLARAATGVLIALLTGIAMKLRWFGPNP